MIEDARFGFVFEFLEPLGQAVKAESMQLVERRMGEHADFLSMVVAGTAQIGVVEERGLRALAALVGAGADQVALELGSGN